MTLEEAQERILELEGQVNELQNERDSLSQNNDELTQNLENARQLNQKLFERVQQQNGGPGEPEPEEDPPTCEEFAKTLNII